MAESKLHRIPGRAITRRPDGSLEVPDEPISAFPLAIIVNMEA